ncbi:MAG: Fic family protein [Verrucomicrobiota bacterium]
MSSPSENLAKSLERLRKLQSENGAAAIRSRDLPRVDRERLLKNGFLQEVMKGWYVPSRADEMRGESTAWYASFWKFCAAYLNERFDAEWSLSPEQSLSLHAGNWSVPQQLLVRATKAGNKVIQLPHGTSILDVRASLPAKENRNDINGLRLFSLEAALIASAPTFFKQSPNDARTALSVLKDASSLLSHLLDGGHSLVAGRLAGAYRNIGRSRVADDIVATMSAAGYTIRESDPFEDSITLHFPKRETSPYVNRINLLWHAMRGPVIGIFPQVPGLPKNATQYMQKVDEIYVTDAYHSLSIEGYKVTTEMIERVRSGNWNPDDNEADRAQRDAMAARGYWQSFQKVHKSVESILNGKNAGEIADQDHGSWYRELFAPSVTAGLLRPSDLAGYRSGQVYIRGSMHVPMKAEAVSDCMTTFFELLAEEENAAARVVLGHFFFVYIHPYMDGNGRIGRFLMNAMLAAGGYPWTVIPLTARDRYMNALERASTEQNIEPFARLISELVTEGPKEVSIS